MSLSIEEAKKQIIKAGHDLVENGLVARTWGNISARLSDDEFLITPSGKPYETLSENDLVVVKIADGSYEGEIKPSSEKGFHAEIYRIRDDINFIIHTHQYYASAISIAGEDFEFAPCCDYGLPGTQGLKKAVASKVFKNRGKNCFLMKSHGAICLGSDSDEAFRNAFELEKLSAEVFSTAADGIFSVLPDSGDYGRSVMISAVKTMGSSLSAYIDDFAQMFGHKADLRLSEEKLFAGPDREAMQMVFLKNCAAAVFASRRGIKPLAGWDCALQRFVYKNKYSKLAKK